MPANNAAAVSAFIEGAPPGELADVIADIQKLTVNEPNLLGSVTPAFQKYNEEQLSTVKLPGSGHTVLISLYNSLGDGKYYDVETRKSFAFDHQSQKASDVQPYNADSEHSNLISSLLKSLSTHSTEHYPSATYTVCPTPSSPHTIALLLVSNKYSPSNFWNGRYRSNYLFTPSSSTLSGTINVDVHYYEDGNVRLTTTKKIPEMKLEASTASSSSAAAEVLRKIAGVERAYQEELNRGFGRLSEGEFKGLRRQLPVTRQKVEWEKIGGYRVSLF
ncbi:MAG: hypothetical protein L6R42_001596 [Xanthoria sp. 1 TBL-2021]|nr:MAG: hypothetical protein L6R42_001596 [Xanthoria sp. 1 TBL-2021]